MDTIKDESNKKDDKTSTTLQDTQNKVDVRNIPAPFASQIT